MRTSRPEDSQLLEFAEPECSPPLPVEILRTAHRERMVQHEVVEDRFTLTDRNDSGRYRFVQDGLETEDCSCDTLTMQEGEPLSLRVHCERFAGVGRGNWQTCAEAIGTMTATREAFQVTSTLEVFENEQRVFAKTWDFQIPRDGV
jgi:hypothetical protein